MRELHVVALSEDGRSVLLAPSKKAGQGAFRVKLDGKLSAAVRGELPREGESAVRAVDVSPKEIQARMRAGESAQQIAEAAGVPLARVERFAGPVLSERERIIAQARAGFVTRGRLGPSQLPLGDAVQAALAETDSLRPESVQWSTRRLDSGHWLVQVSYIARARAKTASWVLDPVTRALTASDPASSALGHRSDVPPTGTAAAVAEVAAQRAAAERTTRSVTRRPAKKSGARRATTATTSASAKTSAAKAGTTRAGTTKAAAAKAPTRKAVPAKKAPTPTSAPAKKAAARKAPAKKAAAAPKPSTTAARTASATGPARRGAAARPAGPTLHVVPPPPEQVERDDAAQALPPVRKRAAGERASVPAWADVLLGISPREAPDR